MSSTAPSSSAQPQSPSSEVLFARSRLGDSVALDRVIARCLPRLHQWAHGRLQRFARSGVDTADLVQEVVMRTFPRIGHGALRGHAALAAYLRQAVLNRIRNEHRNITRRGAVAPPPESRSDSGLSPEQQLLDNEREARYRAALERLTPSDRQLIVGHVELGYSHAKLGHMSNRSANAARVALQRAVGRLLEDMRDA